MGGEDAISSRCRRRWSSDSMETDQHLETRVRAIAALTRDRPAVPSAAFGSPGLRRRVASARGCPGQRGGGAIRHSSPPPARATQRSSPSASPGVISPTRLETTALPAPPTTVTKLGIVTRPAPGGASARRATTSKVRCGVDLSPLSSQVARQVASFAGSRRDRPRFFAPPGKNSVNVAGCRSGMPTAGQELYEVMPTPFVSTTSFALAATSPPAAAMATRRQGQVCVCETCEEAVLEICPSRDHAQQARRSRGRPRKKSREPLAIARGQNARGGS